MSEILTSLFLIAGTATILTGALGVVRLPDVYNRMHASGKNTTLGIVSILIAGTLFFSRTEGLTLKLLLVIPFLFWTASAGSFMIGRAAHRTGTPMAPETVRDDLAAKKGTARHRY